MKRNKLLTLACLLCMAATSMAQVTFDLNDGSNDSWVIDSYTNLNTEGRIWQTNPGGNSYVIFKASEATYIQGYTITLNQLSVDSDNNYKESGLPYTWTLSGSNDKQNWTKIHRQVQANRVKEDVDNGYFKSAGKSYTYYCNSNEQFLYYKLNVTGKYGGTWGGFKMARFDLIPSSVGFSSTASNAMMDGDTGTKVDGAASSVLPYSITISGTAATRIMGFQLTTGNDNAGYNGRNPRNIQVEGSTDNIDWTTIQSWENYTGLGDKNYYPYVLKFHSPQEYQYYRLTFDNVSANWFQMSEIAIVTPLQIGTAAQLANFASLVNNGTTGADAILIDNIGYTSYSAGFIGTSSNKYAGTFDGQMHTITLGLEGDAAIRGLFAFINGATIRNLVVGGSISSDYNNIGGLGGRIDGSCTVENVVVNTSISYTGTGSDASCGGFFPYVYNDQTLTLRNCAFYGSVYAGTATGNAGLVSWNSGTVSATNCLVAPADVTSGGFSDYARGNNPATSNCYKVEHTDTRLASGELCYLLNGDQSSLVWNQVLGTDAHPTPDSSKPNVYEIAVSSAGYASFVPKANILALPTGVTAYAGQKNGNYVHLEGVTELPADNAVIVKAAAGNYYCNSTTESRSLGTSNDLTYSDTEFDATGTQYCLADGASGIGFYQVQSGISIPARKAYLTVPAAIKEFYGFEDDDPTGINDLRDLNDLKDSQDVIFNLAGQRTSRLQKGINIINGKKVLK